MAGLATTLGSGTMTSSIGDIRQTEVLLVTGSNTTEAHPVIALEMKAAVRRHGARLILVDPREIELSQFATLHLRPRPGTDTAVFNAMAQVILTEGLANQEFIKNRTENLEPFLEAVRECPPEWAEGISGVPAEQIRSAARMYARARTAGIFWALGITESTHGVDNVFSLSNLALLTGQIGRPGTGLYPLRGQNNVQGASDMGASPNVFPGYQPVGDAAVREKFSHAWGVDDLPSVAGLTSTEVMNAALEGGVRAFFIMGENPLLTDPNLSHVAEALDTLDFLVVQDIFPTETAMCGDVVLPGVSFAEKDGTFTNTERRVQRIRQALPPVGQARPDWQILCDLGRRMSHAMGLPIGQTSPVTAVRTAGDWEYTAPSEIWDEIAELLPSVSGIHYDRLEDAGLQWPCPTPDHPGTPIMHRERFTRGLGKFMPVHYRPPAELPDEDYPLILSTGRILFHWHGGTMSRRSPGLEALAPQAEVEIHPEDAARVGVEEGKVVEVASRRGRVRAQARITRRSPPGVIFMTFHYAEAAANLLTMNALDPISKIPEYKVCAVTVKPL